MVGPPSMGQSSRDSKEVSLLHLFVLICYSIKEDTLLSQGVYAKLGGSMSVLRS